MRNLYILCTALLLAAGCANVVTPSGGEKDVIPPNPIAFTPDTNSTGFEAKEIRIQFNEFIQLNDVFNQVIVSPPLNNAPEFKMKGKTLIIKLLDTLKTNTTYTINFGQAIKDLTEGNVLDNFTYVFSTGAVLDSLRISGSVNDAVTGKPVEKAYVVLYYEPTDTSFTTTRPYYFARTNKAGGYSIENIREGAYRLYALEDMNFNYFYDLPNERIGFSDSVISINKNIENYSLQLFSENKIPQQLKEIKSPRYGMTRLVFTKDAQDVQLQYTGADTSSIYIAHNQTGDTVMFWKSNYALDTHKLSIAFDTSIIERTIAIKTLHKDSVFARQINTFKHNAIALNKGNDAAADWDPEKPVKLEFYNPVMSITDTPKIYRDSIFLGAAEIIIDSNDARYVYLNYSWLTDATYSIVIPQNGMRDIFGLPNKADTIKLKIRKPDAYSDITLNLSNTTGKQLIVELMRFDGTPIKTWALSDSAFTETDVVTLKQKYLIPGVYRIRAIIDTDGNGAWTTGDLQLNRQPEHILFYPTDQNLRANWENEIEWEIK